MQSVLLVIHVLVALALIGLVLIQHGKGADMGAAFGSGASGSLFGSRGPTTFLTRTTAGLAVVFFVTSLTLGYLFGQSVERRSVVERIEAPTQQELMEEGRGDAPQAPGTTDAPQPPAPEPAPASQ